MNDNQQQCDNPDTEHPGFPCNHPADDDERNGTVICHECGQRHHAEYSHQSQYGNHRVYAVVCTVTSPDIIDYYTDEVVDLDTAPEVVDLNLSTYHHTRHPSCSPACTQIRHVPECPNYR